MRIITLLFLLTITGLLKAQSDSDIQGVEKAVRYYLDGGTNGDREMVAQAFHPQAELKFVRDGQYSELSLDDFLSRIKPSQDATKPKRKTWINYIQVAGDAASAGVTLDYPDVQMIDFFNLVKIDGEWKIVNKIFSRREKAPVEKPKADQ